MEYRCCKNIVLFLLFLIPFFQQTIQIKAVTTQYDPTSEYSVRSAPNTDHDLNKLKLEQQTQFDESFIHTSETDATNLHSISNSGQATSDQDQPQRYVPEFLLNTLLLLKKAWEFWLLCFLTGLLFLGRMTYGGVIFFYLNLYEGFKENGAAWVFLTWMSALAPFVTFTFFTHHAVLRVIQNIVKSTFDLHVRLVIVIISIAFGVLNDKPWKKAYTYLLNAFEHKTHFHVGKLSQDLLWVGGVLATLLIFMGGEAVISGGSSSFLNMQSLSTSVETAVTYLVKETRSAFTETEKECNSRKEECSDVFEKGIILAFNYLPGAMPDLDLDEGVIRLKQILFDIDETELITESNSGVK